jgi:protein TonB
MKRLLWAGVVALLLHGALLLIKFSAPQVQQPRPRPQGICLTLTAMPQEQPKVKAESKPPPVKKQAKPAIRQPVPPPPSRLKPVAPPHKVKEQPAVAAEPVAHEQEVKTADVAEPARQQDLNAPQPGAMLPAAGPAAESLSTNDTEQPAVVTQAAPLYRQNPPPDYPPLARRRGQEGTVQLEVLVNSRGGVNDIRLAKSSGHELLDRAAVRAVQTWLFQPGKRGEQTIDMWVRVPIRFALHD